MLANQYVFVKCVGTYFRMLLNNLPCLAWLWHKIRYKEHSASGIIRIKWQTAHLPDE